MTFLSLRGAEARLGLRSCRFAEAGLIVRPPGGWGGGRFRACRARVRARGCSVLFRAAGGEMCGVSAHMSGGGFRLSFRAFLWHNGGDVTD